MRPRYLEVYHSGNSLIVRYSKARFIIPAFIRFHPIQTTQARSNSNELRLYRHLYPGTEKRHLYRVWPSLAGTGNGSCQHCRTAYACRGSAACTSHTQ
jgi:hypothetical protein